jgi:NADH-quinone oxidoreductase subunit M
LDALSGMALNRALPFAAFSFVIASAASMGIPGFSGFAAEITILIGTWKNYPHAVWITGIGMVLVAAFTLRALKSGFFGERLATPADSPALERITAAEKIGAIVLMFSTLAAGIYPKFLLDRIMPAVETMTFLQP